MGQRIAQLGFAAALALAAAASGRGEEERRRCLQPEHLDEEMCMLQSFVSLSRRSAVGAAGDRHNRSALEATGCHDDRSELVRRFRAALYSNAPMQQLQWDALRNFPPMPSGRGMLDSEWPCENVGRRYPALVSNDNVLQVQYAQYACESHKDYFLTDPTVSLDAQLAEMRGGCLSQRTGWHWSSMAANGTHAASFQGPCTDEQCWLSRREQGFGDVFLLDGDILAIPTAENENLYQHLLLDYLAQVHTALDVVRQRGLRVLSRSKLQTMMLRSIGLAEEHIAKVDVQLKEQVLLCVQPTNALYLWRVARHDGGDLAVVPGRPELEHPPNWKYGDFWHRMINYQVGHEVAEAILAYNGRSADLEVSGPGHVIFLLRHSPSRTIANEDEAAEVARATLKEAQRPEEFVAFVPGEAPFVEQVSQLYRASLVIGQHGGAMGNLLFARRSTGVIEFVGTPAAHRSLSALGEWPPYKSYWYGGEGAALRFFRVVAYDADEMGAWRIDLGSLQKAMLESWSDGV